MHSPENIKKKEKRENKKIVIRSTMYTIINEPQYA